VDGIWRDFSGTIRIQDRTWLKQLPGHAKYAVRTLLADAGHLVKQKSSLTLCNALPGVFDMEV
jgi:hypothetical protein